MDRITILKEHIVCLEKEVHGRSVRIIQSMDKEFGKAYEKALVMLKSFEKMIGSLEKHDYSRHLWLKEDVERLIMILVQLEGWIESALPIVLNKNGATQEWKCKKCFREDNGFDNPGFKND